MDRPPVDNSSDAQLVRRYRAGDAGAMHALVKCYERRLFGYICKMTANIQTAEEIFQETWLRVIRNIDNYRENNFAAWLFRIARNLCIDRRRAHVPGTSLDACDDDGKNLLDTLPADQASPATTAADGELQEHLAAALKMLPPEQREVFLLRFESDMAFKDIAKIQGVSINTALARMQYAIRKLRELLTDTPKNQGAQT